MNTADLFVRCLENEGVKYIFGVPGEENAHFMMALEHSSIRFMLTRHEQGAAFMADVYGRLTGEAGVCLGTLGPGATNLVTGVADANMDRAPCVVITGQADSKRQHKESHQNMDVVSLFGPITKWATPIRHPDNVPEVVRKAFKLATTEKPGACHIELAEDIAQAEVHGKQPLPGGRVRRPVPDDKIVDQAWALIRKAERPLILAGNGCIRKRASRQLRQFCEATGIGVISTFMGKGAVSRKADYCMYTMGLQARDRVSLAVDAADVIITIGYDLVEYHPYLWHPTRDRKIIHIDLSPAEVDASYPVEVGVIGDIKHSLMRIAKLATPHQGHLMRPLRQALIEDMNQHAEDDSFPVKPQKLIWDLRTALDLEDIVVCDVGAHKMWMARMFRCEYPNTCLISNGFASMGIAVPGAIAAKMVNPDRAVVAVTGDAGFMMNSQEIETAMRLQVPIVVLIWNDGGYGLIEWKQINEFGRPSHVHFGNPDFVKYAESFGARGYRIERTADLLPTLSRAIAEPVLSIIDCPVDYQENLILTEKLGKLVCPI